MRQLQGEFAASLEEFTACQTPDAATAPMNAVIPLSMAQIPAL